MKTFFQWKSTAWILFQSWKKYSLYQASKSIEILIKILFRSWKKNILLVLSPSLNLDWKPLLTKREIPNNSLFDRATSIHDLSKRIKKTPLEKNPPQNGVMMNREEGSPPPLFPPLFIHFSPPLLRGPRVCILHPNGGKNTEGHCASPGQPKNFSTTEICPKTLLLPLRPSRERILAATISLLHVDYFIINIWNDI